MDLKLSSLWSFSYVKKICYLKFKPHLARYTDAFPGGEQWQPTLVFLPGESHGRKSLEGYSPQGLKESDRLKQLNTA